ncbi:MAG: PKD domain-containing protein, partial [Flavobacteriales bacterium]|nr:PKD domain-containing protein [Flavobacteriales bacterium]
MNSNIGAFPGASFTSSCVCSPVTGTFDWTPTVGDIGTHFLSINIQDDGCPILGTQFLNVTIIVLQGTLAGPDQFSCPSGGPIQLNATGGSVFTWTPSTGLSCTVCPSPLATPTSTTTYTVTSDLSSTCVNTDQVTVFVIPDIVVDVGPDITVCLNEAAQLNATVNPPGEGPFTYSWTPTTDLSNPTIANPVAIPGSTTTYTVTVTSAAGCTVSDNIVVTISGVAPAVTATSNRDTICPGDTTQLFAFTGGSGMEDNFDPGIDNAMWSNISNGTANTNCGSMSGNALMFDGSATPREATTNSLDLTACTSIDFCIIIGSGAAPCENADAGEDVTLQYSTDGGATWTVINVYDEASTTTWTCVSVPIPAGALTANTMIQWVQPSFSACAGCDNWSIDDVSINCSGGGSYTYAWTPSASLSDPTISNPVATVNGTTTYTVSVIDVNNPSCSGSAFVTVVTAAAESVVATPDTTICLGSTVNVQLNAVATGTPPPACNACGANGTTCSSPVTDKDVGTGTASNTTSGYPAPYGNWYKNAKHQFLYLASELTAAGLTCGTITSLGFDIAAMNPSVSTYKNFELKVGCTTITSLTTWQSGLATVFTPKNVTIGAGWTAHPFDFTYDWDGTSNIIVEVCFDNRPDAFTQNASTRYTTTGFTSALYYRSDVTAACPITTQTTSSNRPNIRFSSCNSSGGGGFTYSWSPTPGLNDPNIQNPVATVSSTIDYVVTVTGGACAVSDTATITFINCTCTPPDPSGVITHVLCNGGTTGAINVSVSGGVSPYTYLWSNGPTTQDLSGLAAGVYTVTVTDNAGCDSIMPFTVTQPPLLTSSVAITDETCPGACNGAINLTVVGGTGLYTYVWSNGATVQDISGLCALSFQVTITDANGCQNTQAATVGTGGNVNASFTVNANQCLAGNTFNFANAGDTPNSCGANCPTFTYDFGDGSPPISGNNAADASPSYTYSSCGTFTVTLTVDDGTCTDVFTQAVEVFCEPVAALVPLDESCDGACDGSINLTPSGGLAPYTFAWSNGETTEDISGLCVGSYTVTITDANGCIVNETTNINVGPTISASFTYNGNQCVAGNSYLFTNTGSTGGTYSWDFGDGSGSSTLENPTYAYTSAGTYIVTQTVTVGICSDNTTMTIIVYDGPTASISGVDESCPGVCNGTADLTAVVGDAIITNYLWDNGATTQDLSGLCAGTYNVTITDLNGCQTTASVVIGSGAGVTAGFNVSPTTACLTGNSFSFNNIG